MAPTRARVAAGVVVIILAAGAAVLAYRHLHRPALADPQTVQLPAQTATSRGLQRYFTAGGRPMVRLLRDTRSLSRTGTKATCSTIAARLDHIGTPAALTSSAVNTPDPNVRDAAVNHVQAVQSYLSDCGVKKDVAADAKEAQFTATVLSRLLERAGVRL
jgi:hypothetical protein